MPTGGVASIRRSGCQDQHLDALERQKILLTLGRPTQQDFCEFEARLNYRVRPCFKIQSKRESKYNKKYK